MMNRLFYVCLAVALVASCAKEPVVNNDQQEVLVPTTIVASFDDATKTSLDGTSVLWTEGDKVSVFDGTGKRSFTVESVSSDGKQAVLTGSTGEGAAEKTWRFIYPESALAERGTDDLTKTNIQRVQLASSGTFAPGVNVMSGVATPEQRGEENNVSMKNVGALVKIVVADSDITSITLAAEEKLSGLIGIDANNPVEIKNYYSSHNSVTLASPNGNLEPGSYYITVLPCTLNGFVLYLTNADGRVAKRTNSSEFKIERNTINTIEGFDTGINWYWPNVTGIALGFNSETNNGGSWSVGTWPFNEEAPSSGGSESMKKKVIDLTTKTGSHKFTYYSNSYNPMFGASGFRFGKHVGDYLDFPAFEGKMLTGVKMRAGNVSDRPAIGYHNETQRLTANFISEGSGGLNQGDKVSWAIAPYYLGDVLCFVQQAETQPIALGSLVLTYNSFEKVQEKTIELNFKGGNNPFVAQDKLFSEDWTKQFTNCNCYTAEGFEFTLNAQVRLHKSNTVNFKGLGFNGANHEMELPVIKGFRLSKIEIDGGNYTDSGTAPTTLPGVLLRDSNNQTKYDLQGIKTGTHFEKDLTNLNHSERYKLRTTANTAFEKLILTYTRVE